MSGAWGKVKEKPAAFGASAFGAAAIGLGMYFRQRHVRSLARAVRLQANVRVVKRRPVDDVAAVLDLFAKGNDDVETIRCATFARLEHARAAITSSSPVHACRSRECPQPHDTPQRAARVQAPCGPASYTWAQGSFRGRMARLSHHVRLCSLD